MAQQLKRWESPRQPGRNHKGRGGTARQRQLRKRNQALRKRLSDSAQDKPNSLGEQFAPLFVVSGWVVWGDRHPPGLATQPVALPLDTELPRA